MLWLFTTDVPDPGELPNWAPEGYENGGSDPEPSWCVGLLDDSVQRLFNAYPGIFYSDLPSIQAIQNFSTTIRVASNPSEGDDDFIGFVLGFQPGDSSNPADDYLLVEWKGASEVCAPAGLAVSRVSGVPAASDLWEHSGSVAELQRGATLGNTGWASDTDYVFDVRFTESSLDVSVNGSPELSITGSFGDGRFGFYNYSQPAAIHLPEPGANAGIVLAACFPTPLRRRGKS